MTKSPAVLANVSARTETGKMIFADDPREHQRAAGGHPDDHLFTEPVVRYAAEGRR